MDEKFTQIVDGLKQKNTDTKTRKDALTDQRATIASLDAVQRAVVQSIKILMQAMLTETLSVSVQNQPETIQTPDALTGADIVKSAIKDLEWTVANKETDYEPILGQFKAVLEALAKLPTEYPEFPEMPSELIVSNLGTVVDELKNLSKEIKALEVAPNITVKPTDVKVDAPVVNIQLDDQFKRLEEVLLTLQPLDNSEEARLMHDMMITNLQGVQEAVRSIKIPVPNNKPVYVSSDNKSTPVTLTSDGRVPVELGVSPTIDIGDVQIKNVSGTVINPSTEEKQNTTITAVNAVASGLTELDLFGAGLSTVRYNQVEIDYAVADPDDISDITVTKTSGGDATTANGQAVFSTGTSATGGIKAVTNKVVTYRPHNESYAAFSAVFTAGVANSYQRLGIFDTNNGFFIGYEGTSFGVTVRKSTVDTTVAKASFNVDTLSGGSTSKYTRNGTPETLDPTKDNLYRIRFGWLGASSIYFEVLSPDQKWVVFHIHRVANTAVVPSIANPNLPITLDARKTSGTSNLTISTACWAGGTNSNMMKVTDTITDSTLAPLSRSVITGQTTAGGGGYVNVKVNPSGALVTATTIDSGTVSVSNFPATQVVSGTVTATSPTYRTLIDETTTAGVTYVGKAAIGSAKSAAAWQISKIDETTSVTDITWSGTGFTAIWDNRTSISYT